MFLAGKRVKGHIAHKTRGHCRVVIANGRTYKAPWPMVTSRPDGRRKQVVTQVDQANSRFQTDDRVECRHKGGAIRGSITRIISKTATVSTANAGNWRLHYRFLSRVSTKAVRDPSYVPKAVAAKADRLLRKHGLKGWSFQFDEASTRGGICDHQIQTISMARGFCQKASEAEWTDVLLHEIAHALV